MENRKEHPFTFSDLQLNLGKQTRLHRLMYDYGPGGGTIMLLPIDQGLEHGPRDFFTNPPSQDPAYQVKLAVAGGFSGIVLHYGLAHKYMPDVAGKLPLVLKLNGKTEVPSDASAFSPLTGTVEDAVRLGADAVGYTLYVGSPSQDRDFDQLRRVREDADRFGMPLIVWAYPRGQAIEERGGRDSVYAIDYAARVSTELGADIIKLNMPKLSGIDRSKLPAPYNEMEFTPDGAIRQIVASAGRSYVILSGGSRVSDEDVLDKVRLAMEAGARGMIFGRNMWQRPWDKSLALSAKLHELLKQYAMPEQEL